MERARWTAVLAGISVAACSTPGGGTAPATTPPVREVVAPADGPMSDPAEYQIERVSREAGRAIFERTGLGDPYRTGVPYPIWLALVRRYPDLFGGDVATLADRFGMIARAPDPASDDRDVRAGLPVGLHLTDDPNTGVAFVVHSCALCHTERLRWRGGEALVSGLGNKRLRVHDYDAAFSAAARRPDFELVALMTDADREAATHEAAWPYDWRVPLTDATVKAMKQRARDREAYLAKVAGGPPGRVAVIEAFALALGLRLGREIATAPDVGWSKIPDVIGFGARTTLSFDGAGEGPMDLLVVEADVAAGARPAWFLAHPLQGASLGAYLRMPDRALPFPGKINRKLVARGRASFDDNCAPCHGVYADDGRVRLYAEQVVPLADLGTDPARANAVTMAFVEAANRPELAPGIPPGTLNTRRTGGYVPPVLTSVWARAPYGHAGQWPSLNALATAPALRTVRYLVDLDAPYDLEAVGVTTRVPGKTVKPSAGAYLYDGDRRGFSVLGHPFLSDLGPAEAAAVIEYLKTL